MHQQITVNSEIIAMFLLMQIIRQDVRLNNKNSNFNIFQRYYTKFAEMAKIGTSILDGCKRIALMFRHSYFKCDKGSKSYNICSHDAVIKNGR